MESSAVEDLGTFRDLFCPTALLLCDLVMLPRILLLESAKKIQRGKVERAGTCVIVT